MSADIISLSIPAKSEYMLPVRLCVSGIASRLNYDIEDTENIKMAVQEACLILLAATESRQIKLDILVADAFEITICSDGEYKKIENEQTLEFSKMILQALVDQVEFEDENGVCNKITIHV